jgi:hypothetical protein
LEAQPAQLERCVSFISTMSPPFPKHQNLFYRGDRGERREKLELTFDRFLKKIPRHVIASEAKQSKLLYFQKKGLSRDPLPAMTFIPFMPEFLCALCGKKSDIYGFELTLRQEGTGVNRGYCVKLRRISVRIFLPQRSPSAPRAWGEIALQCDTA